MLEKLCNLASDDLLNVECRSCLSLISLRALVEGDRHLVSTSPPLPTSPTFWAKITKKDDDYHFSVKNTELISQRNSPFDFTTYKISPSKYKPPKPVTQKTLR